MDGGKTDRQGARDAAVILPVLATILLVPPIILIFARPVLVGGVPLILLYLFGVWAAVIFAALWLSKRLPGDEAESDVSSGRDESGRA